MVDLEALLASEVRAYVNARRDQLDHGAEPFRFPDDDQEGLRRIQRETDELVKIGGTLGWFLNTVDDPWDPYGGVDYLLPDSAIVLSPVAMEIRGLLRVWGGNHHIRGDVPFFGVLKVAPDEDRLDYYRFAFGDPDVGVRRRHDGWHKRPSQPERWLFVIEKSHAA